MAGTGARARRGRRHRRVLHRRRALLRLESCPHYLLLSTESGIGPQGKVAPPLRRPADLGPLVEAVLAGDIDFFGSDHNVWPAEAKRDMWSGRAGLPGIGLLLPLLATELVAKRGLGFDLRYWPWSTVRGGAVVYQEGEFPNDDLRGDILNEVPRPRGGCAQVRAQ